MSNKHYYLDKITTKEENRDSFPENIKLSKPLKKIHKKRIDKERKKYGFGINEIWDLDYTTACWIYEHLSYYLDYCSDLLDEISFEINILKENDEELTLIKKEASMDEAIKICLKYLKYYITEKDDDNNQISVIKKHKYITAALHIYAEIAPSLWI